MTLVYFDQNVFDHLLDAAIDAREVAEAMGAHNYVLALSEDNFQEWAACWNSGRPSTEQRGQRLIGYALSLRASRFLAPLPQMLTDEAVARLRHRRPNPFLSGAEAAHATALLTRAASEGLDGSDRQKTLARWKQKEEITARFGGEQKRVTPDMLQDHTFEAFLVRQSANQVEIATRLLQVAFAFFKPLDTTSNRIIHYALRRWNKCPTLRTAVRTNLFVTFQLINGRAMPHDRWDDLRHCIAATHADVFVTRDKNLKTSCQQIRPGPRLLTVSEFTGEIGIQYAGS